MAKGIDMIKKELVKKGLLKGKNTKQALLDAGYSKNTAVHSNSLSVVKCSQKEISDVMDKMGWTTERLLEEIEWGLKQSKQRFHLSSHKGYCEILARHYLPLREEVRNHSSFDFTPEERKEYEEIRMRFGLSSKG